MNSWENVVRSNHQYQHIEYLGFTDILDIPEFEDEIVIYVLRRVHGEFMLLDRPYKITKEAIWAIRGLSLIGQHLDKKVSNDFVRKIIGATSNEINEGKIKGDKKGTFRYGNVLVCLILFFLNDTLDTGRKQCAFDIPIGKQLKQSLIAFKSLRDDKVWGYLKPFQKSVRSRIRVLEHIVEK